MELTQEQYERVIQSQQMAGVVSDTSTKQYMQQMAQNEQNLGLAEAQLEVDSILENIENLLKGNRLVNDVKQGKVWVPPQNNHQKVLSDEGVQRFMQTVRFHINRNTLMSNFDAIQIDRQMLNFMKSINGYLLQNYENLFYIPTIEECVEIFNGKLEEKKQLRMFVKDFLGENYTEEQVTREIELEMEDRISKEIDKIRDEQISRRLKEYDLLLEEVESQVYATYNRAFAGEERGSLRRNSQFSDVRTSGPQMQQKQGGFFSWITGK